MKFGGHQCLKCKSLFRARNKRHRKNNGLCPKCNKQGNGRRVREAYKKKREAAQ